MSDKNGNGDTVQRSEKGAPLTLILSRIIGLLAAVFAASSAVPAQDASGAVLLRCVPYCPVYLELRGPCNEMPGNEGCNVNVSLWLQGKAPRKKKIISLGG